MILHTIELTEAGYKLVIWEPAPKNANRVSPFMFRATYLLAYPWQASEILNMVEGENETTVSQLSSQALNQQTEQKSCQPSSERVPVLLQG
jgi:hypothetical protein